MRRRAETTPLLLLLFLLMLDPGARAQLNAPHLAYLLPAGGRQGTTFEVRVGGQFLANVTGIRVTGGGIQGVATEYTRPMNGMQATQLRERLQELQKQPMDDAVRKEMLDIRTKLLIFNNTRSQSPALAEVATLRIAIAADAEPGQRELRLGTPQGWSNPLVFCVGLLPEFTEKESIDVSILPGSSQPRISQASALMDIELPATVNGRIKPGLSLPEVPARPGRQFTPGDVDRYRFKARKGQQLVVVVSARELIPYLADAVPGWFQAAVGLFDAAGRELAYEDHYRYHPDPVLFCRIPEDGEYVIEIKDALYRGREDFIYRITAGELPFVDSIFPLGGRTGSKTTVMLTGWNLPANKVTMESRGKETGTRTMFVRKDGLLSNTVTFAMDSLPETAEKEPNGAPGNAQRVRMPLIVNGRIDRPGDWDVFRFDGRSGDRVVAEVIARRLGSPLDSVLKLTDASGRQLAFNDDHEDKGSGLDTHHADSLVTAVLPAKGKYFLSVGDAQQRGGPEYAYRLRISAPRPDFELRVTPSSLNVLGGMTAPVTVYALRKDGYSGEIALALKDAPRGFALSGGLMPAGQDSVRVTLTAPPQPLRDPADLVLEGRAVIMGHEVRRVAVPAEDMMQAFAYRQLVPAKDLRVAVIRRGPFGAAAAVLSPQPVKIPTGETVRISTRLSMNANTALSAVHFELSQPPEGIALVESAPLREGFELALSCDTEKVKAGLKGNLIVNILAERTPPSTPGRPQPNRQRVPLGTLPAIPFEIVKR